MRPYQAIRFLLLRETLGASAAEDWLSADTAAVRERDVECAHYARVARTAVPVGKKMARFADPVRTEELPF